MVNLTPHVDSAKAKVLKHCTHVKHVGSVKMLKAKVCKDAKHEDRERMNINTFTP